MSDHDAVEIDRDGLYEAALRACRSGIVMMDFGSFISMEPEIQTMLAKAGQVVMAEKVCATAVALSGEEGFARVYSHVDDGEMLEGIVLDDAMVSAAKKFLMNVGTV